MAYTTINKSTDHFNTLLYTGTGAENALTGVGFQPDWIWLKKRGASGHHFLQDVVRGATYQIKTSTTDAQSNNAQYVKSIQSDGFTLGTDSDVNPNGGTAVAWNWKAANSQGASNTDGSINTTYTSANTTAGFSISQYTGTGSNATIGHGLGAAPNVVIIKKLSTTSQWIFGTTALGFTKFLEFNLTGAAQTQTNRFNDTDPTSSVFSIGTEGDVNSNGGTYIAYCFAEKKGYSKFGKYTGNGNSDGSFIYTGFKPAFIIIKNSEESDAWHLYDNKRLGYNVDNNALYPNASDAEQTNDDLDILSNGFKIRRNIGTLNNSSRTYIYMAFGQTIVGTNNVPAVAR